VQNDSATIDRAWPQIGFDRSQDEASSLGNEQTTGHSPLFAYPSVWLHGAGMSASTFRHVVKGLPKATALDLPGHGSAAAVHPPRVESYADQLAPSIPPGAILIGHSLGGMVALELAARRELQVAALVMIEAVPTVRDRLSGRLTATLASALMRVLPMALLTSPVGQSQKASTRQEVKEQLSQHSRTGLIAAMEAAGHYDGRRHLNAVAVPTLIVVGQDNRATHHGAKLAARRITGSEFATLPGGHMLHFDSPVPLRRTIDQFLKHRLTTPGS